jgi:hypothetical protein
MNILIIGGGAAGFFGAITCAEANPDASITILERSGDVLQKVRISGGGRCNVTHACFEPKELVLNYPRGSKELLGPFHRFQPADMIAWLENRSVKLKTETDGRVFPLSDNSMTIVNCLEKAANDAGVKCLLHKNVIGINKKNQEGFDWEVSISGGEVIRAGRILIATGSNKRLWDLISGLGHKIIRPVPSIFTFHVEDWRLRNLEGVSMPFVRLRIVNAGLESSGPLLITHWGLSGPSVLKLSAWGARLLADLNYQFELEINWTGCTVQDSTSMLLHQKRVFAKKHPANSNPTGLPARLWANVLLAAGIEHGLRWADLSNEKILRLSKELCGSTFLVSGKSTFKEEFVTAGGVSLDEIDFRTFQSRIHRGLFFAGEILDIDGVTGGFNFQAAWTGGYLSGKAMADPL